MHRKLTPVQVGFLVRYAPIAIEAIEQVTDDSPLAIMDRVIAAEARGEPIPLSRGEIMMLVTMALLGESGE